MLVDLLPKKDKMQNVNVETTWKDSVSGGKYDCIKKNSILFVVATDSTVTQIVMLI